VIEPSPLGILVNGTILSSEDVALITSFLQSLSGEFQGKQL
jgi:hypothetical protein